MIHNYGLHQNEEFSFFAEKWGMKNEKSIFFIFCQILAFFDDFSKLHNVSSTFHFKNLARNEEKPCLEIFTSQKLKKWVKANAFLTIFICRIFFRFFFRFSRKITANSSFIAKNENAKKMGPIVASINQPVWHLLLHKNVRRKVKRAPKIMIPVMILGSIQ